MPGMKRPPTKPTKKAIQAALAAFAPVERPWDVVGRKKVVKRDWDESLDGVGEEKPDD